jgi:hypothetical protein
MQTETAEHICLNCGAELHGEYCSKCGQRASTAYDRSVRSFLEHFFEEFFVWDSRFLRSIKYLLIRPGYLTKEFMAGRMQNYISPLKMFLFTSLIVFFILIKVAPDTYNELVTEGTEDIDYISEFIVQQQNQSGESKDLYMDNFNEEVSNNVTLYIFFIMVVFAVLLKLVYITKKIYLVQHIVFTLHFYSFVLVCLLLSEITPFLDDLSVLLFFYLIPAIYLFIALKTAYHKTVWKALLASCFLTFCYSILVTGWLLATIFISAMKA